MKRQQRVSLNLNHFEFQLRAISIPQVFPAGLDVYLLQEHLMGIYRSFALHFKIKSKFSKKEFRVMEIFLGAFEKSRLF
jgi:hypothetical protein